MRHRTRAGFTLMEIMIVVVLIGLLMAMAIPTFRSIKRRTTHFRFMNDVRVYKDALETYYMEVGSLPADSAPGSLDPALEPYIRAAKFAEQSPIGGSWDVVADDLGVTLGVGAVGYNLDADELRQLDDRFDDGNLSTGVFRDLISGSGFYYVVED